MSCASSVWLWLCAVYCQRHQVLLSHSFSRSPTHTHTLSCALFLAFPRPFSLVFALALSLFLSLSISRFLSLSLSLYICLYLSFSPLLYFSLSPFLPSPLPLFLPSSLPPILPSFSPFLYPSSSSLLYFSLLTCFSICHVFSLVTFSHLSRFLTHFLPGSTCAICCVYVVIHRVLYAVLLYVAACAIHRVLYAACYQRHYEQKRCNLQHHTASHCITLHHTASQCITLQQRHSKRESVYCQRH